ncbi:major facilitator superfamily transporter [Colletotrichum asianum]|uniref:Major facilitator superfamily transporter n=1 Tax=Colletotrichum asianum TaxID=702518 RepID=A0A8H3W2U2_9PEZI|nr:major facilitator superfamily transporter [Colletotrichum asianum]
MSTQKESTIVEHEDHPTIVKRDAQEVKEESLQDTGRLRASKSLVRKLDMTLMPIIWIMYLFNYLDRTAIAQATLNTIMEDLSLTGEEFSTTVSLLNVGYMIMQIPSNMLLTRVRPSLYLPFWACVWSAVSAATAGVQNFNQLLAVRCILGIAEVPFFPGVYYLLSCWYTKRELGLRMAILYSGLVIATAFSGLIAAGVFSGLDQVRGLAGWRWLYIIVGAVNLFALVAFVLLPDFPESSTGSQKWLFTDSERQVAVARIRSDSVAQESNRSVWWGLRRAVTDYHTWVFIFMLISNHAAYGFNYFYPSIVKGFGLGSNITTLLCTSPPFLIGAFLSIVVSRSSDKRNKRSLHIAVPMLVSIVGFIISAVTVNGPARYTASFLYVTGCFAANGLIYSWAAGVLNQTPEKKAVATSMINVLAQVGNIASPYFFREKDEPRYFLAMILLMVFAALSAAACIFLKWDLRRANRKLAATAVVGTNPKLFTT